MVKGCLKAAALSVAVAISASGASALTTVELDYKGQGAAQAVSTTAGTFSAGAFSMEDTATGFDFLAWCLDISTYLADPATYQVKTKDDPTVFDNGGASGVISSENKERIQGLFDTFYAGVDTAVENAAFQSALWTIVTGANTITNTATASWALASDYLDNLVVDNKDQYTLLFYQAESGRKGPRSQNLVAAFETTPVPLPAGAVLLVTAFGALGVARRRRRAA